MHLKKYIENYANTRCAGDFDLAYAALGKRWSVTPRAVQSWRYLERVPNVETARFIVRNTKGAVGFDGIYAPYKQES